MGFGPHQEKCSGRPGRTHIQDSGIDSAYKTAEISKGHQEIVPGPISYRMILDLHVLPARIFDSVSEVESTSWPNSIYASRFPVLIYSRVSLYCLVRTV